jgi:hypothetical protein
VQSGLSHMTFAEALVKTHRWLTLSAALLITLSEVAIFTSQSARVPDSPANTAAVTDVGRGKGTHRPHAEPASIYRAVAAGTRSAQRVR